MRDKMLSFALTPSMLALVFSMVTTAGFANPSPVANNNNDKTSSGAKALRGTTLGSGNGFVSDDFNVACGEILGAWTAVNPLGDASFNITGVGTSDARMEIALPAGSSHNLWTRYNNVPRIMQPVQNSDFQLETKFDSELTQRYQGQGILIEEHILDYIRFDTYTDGNRHYILIVTVENGSFSIRANVIIPDTYPIWLRMTRAGDLWTPEYSFDGTNWIQLGSFSHTIQVSSVGPFALNFDRNNNAPAHTALVDYVFENSTPILNEDGNINGDHYKDLNVTIDGPGSVASNPDLPEYECGSLVTLTATPDLNAVFMGWTGDYVGNDNPLVLSMENDLAVEAVFEFNGGGGTAPVISNVQIQLGYDNATVSWDTDIPATSRIDYGETIGYELGFVEDPSLLTEHSLVLPNLQSETLHNFLITSVSDDQLSGNSGNQTFTTQQAPPVISNVVVVPTQTSATITWNTDVPASSRVDYGQTVGYELGFEQDSGLKTIHSLVLSPLTSGTLHHFKVSGVNVDGHASETGDDTFLTLAGDPIISNVQVNVASDSATVTWETDQPASSRVDFGETGSYELGFIEDPTLVIQHQLQMTGLNADTLHHFKLTSVNGNGDSDETPDDVFTTLPDNPVISNVQVNVASDGATVTWETDQPASSRVDFGETGSYELGFIEDPTLVIQHQLQMTGLNADTLHHFKLTSVNGNGDSGETPDDVFTTLPGAPVISNVQVAVGEDSATVTWETDQPASSRVDYGETPGYELGFVEDPALVTQHQLQMTGLNADTLHHFQLTSVNGNGDSGETPDDTFTTDPLSAPTLSNIQVIVTESSATITWETDQLASSRVDYGETPGYELGFVEDPTFLDQHSLLLDGLNSDTLHHFMITSVNEDGGSTSSVDMTFTTLVSAPPVISQIDVTVTDTSATVTWTTDQPATSRVDFGETPAYELGFVEDPTLVTDHSLEITGLNSGTTYHFMVTSENASGDPSSSDDLTFQTDFPPTPSGILSDDFNIACETLLSFWTFVDPNGASNTTITGVSTNAAQLNINLPAGVNHNAWTTGLTVPRVMQATADTDFEIEAKFTSPLTQAIQGQGLLVHQTDSHFIRYEAYLSGGQFHIFAATINNGSATVNGDIVLPYSSPHSLRISRVGDNWECLYSFDGQTWNSAFTFSHAMQPGSVGVYGLNYQSGGLTPSHTASVDYFFNTAAPILNEDGQVLGNGGDKTVTVNLIGDGTGTVDRSPDLTNYPCGTEVTLTAVPDFGSEFVGWTGDIESTENPLAVTLLEDLSLVAEFALDTTPPTISDIDATVGPFGAVITWTTDEDATSRVDYGTTPGYELGFDEKTELTQAHTISLSGLAPETTYHYQITSADANELEGISGDLTFTTSEAPPPHPSGIKSDDFNGLNVDTQIWTFTDGSRGDARIQTTGVGTDDAQLRLEVPGTGNHQLENGTAPRLLQPTLNVDFELEAKFESILTSRYQIQGLVIEESADHFIRCDFFHDGAGLRIFWGAYLNGSLGDFGNFGISLSTPYYLRINRTGNSWVLSYSDDGLVWTVADTFNYTLAVSQTGIFAANFQPNNSAPPPAVNCLVDYFFITQNPVVPEDGLVKEDTLPPLVYGIDEISGKEAFVIEWNTDELATSKVRYGLTNTFELGEQSSPVLTRDHSVPVFGLNPETTYFYEIVSGDDLSQESLVTGTITTAPQVAVDGPQIDVWYGQEQTFGAIGIPQTWANVLGNASDGDGVDNLVYSLNGNQVSSLSMGPDDHRLADLGDFNVELDFNDLAPGPNAVVIRALDMLGNETTDVVILHYQIGNDWPKDYSVDWSTQNDLTDVAQPVDGLWTISGGGLVPLQLDYDRVVVMGEHLQWQDYEVTVPITVHALDPGGYQAPSNSPAVGIIMRWPGHVDWDGFQPRRGWWPLGAIGLFRFNEIGAPLHQLQIYGNDGDILDRRDQAVDFDVPYIFKMRVETIDSTQAQYRLKAWKATDPEPPTWDLEGIHVGGTEFGSLALLSHHVDCTFGNVTIVNIGQ